MTDNAVECGWLRSRADFELTGSLGIPKAVLV